MTAGSTPAPGLRKAGDADLHPSTPVGGVDAPLLRKGTNAADSVGGPDRDKLVDLGVKVPKSLRKVVRAEEHAVVVEPHLPPKSRSSSERAEAAAVVSADFQAPGRGLK